MGNKIVINGANGYVASHFISELLGYDYEVVGLVRANNENDPVERMQQTLSEIGHNNKNCLKNLEVFNYSLLDKDFGMKVDNLKQVFDRKVDFFHFAASLKYSERDKEKICKTNITGVENSIKTFQKYAKPGSRFFYVSTAYSCGKISTVFEEKFYDNAAISEFRNYYEKSKREAENVVKKHIYENSLNAYVIRLSQVVGDSESGVVKTDYGIFDFAKRVYYFATKYPGKTIRVPVNPDATQNLIPIDNVVEYFMKLVNLQQLPVVIHFVSKYSIKNECIKKAICDILPVNLVQDISIEKEDLNELERMVLAGMAFTIEYANTNLQFETTTLDEIIAPNRKEITEHSVSKMIEWFLSDISKK